MFLVLPAFIQPPFAPPYRAPVGLRMLMQSRSLAGCIYRVAERQIAFYFEKLNISIFNNQWIRTRVSIDVRLWVAFTSKQRAQIAVIKYSAGAFGHVHSTLFHFLSHFFVFFTSFTSTEATCVTPRVGTKDILVCHRKLRISSFIVSFLNGQYYWNRAGEL